MLLKLKQRAPTQQLPPIAPAPIIIMQRRQIQKLQPPHKSKSAKQTFYQINTIIFNFQFDCDLVIDAVMADGVVEAI